MTKPTKRRSTTIFVILLAVHFMLPAAAREQAASEQPGQHPSPPVVPVYTMPAGQDAGQEQGAPAVQNGGASQPATPWSGQGPIIVPPISFVDVASGRFGKLEINLEDGRFMAGGVDRLHLLANDMDLNSGRLSALSLDIKGGHFEDFTCDRLMLAVQEPLNFDTGSLLNRRMLQFTTPALAKVTAVVTQASLNRFLNSPQTLERLSLSAVGHGFLGGMLAQLGATAAAGIHFSEGSLSLQPNNRIIVMMQGKAGVGPMAVPFPLEAFGRAVLKDGWINLTDTRVTTGGQEIAPQISALVAERINALAAAGSKSEDIRFVFTDLKVTSGDRITMSGIAYVNRLRF